MLERGASKDTAASSASRETEGEEDSIRPFVAEPFRDVHRR